MAPLDAAGTEWPALILGVLCVGVCAACMAAIVRSDLARRIIPRELCWALGAAGLLAQVVSGGLPAALESLLAFAVVGAACLAAIALGALRGSRFCIGGGDLRCMLGLALATGEGAWAGAAACFASAAIVSCARMVKGGLKPGDTFPFAPFLTVWYGVGVLYLL